MLFIGGVVVLKIIIIVMIFCFRKWCPHVASVSLWCFAVCFIWTIQESELLKLSQVNRLIWTTSISFALLFLSRFFFLSFATSQWCLCLRYLVEQSHCLKTSKLYMWCALLLSSTCNSKIKELATLKLLCVTNVGQIEL